jgi:hypothetical protein
MSRMDHCHFAFPSRPNASKLIPLARHRRSLDSVCSPAGTQIDIHGTCLQVTYSGRESTSHQFPIGPWKTRLLMLLEVAVVRSVPRSSG